MPFTGAFIVPIGTYHNTNYIYAGVEARGPSKGEVSAFGGKREQKENIQKTARREFKEESRGVFAKDKSIKKRLANQQKYGVHKIDTRNTCVTYFVPIKIKGNPMERFKDAKTKSSVQKEMSQIIAIKAADVIRAVQATPPGTPMTLHGKPVRALLASVLREGVRLGYIR